MTTTQIAQKDQKDQKTPATELSIEKLTELVGSASGWGPEVVISFCMQSSSPRLTALVGASVEVLGAKTVVSAHGRDHARALVALLQALESHHRQVLHWHKVRCQNVRQILDDLAVYYIKVDL